MTEPTGSRGARWAIPLALLPLVAQSLFDGFYKGPLHQWSETAFWLVDVTKFVLLPAIVLWALARFGGVRPRDYGFRWPRTEPERERFIGSMLLAGLVLVPLYFVAEELIWRLWPAARPAFTYGSALPGEWPTRWLVVAYYSLTAGVVEEIVFRGLPWAWAAPFAGTSAKRWAWVGITSVTFGLVHWENGWPDVLTATLFGIAAAILYLRLRNLWPLVAAHALTDLIAFA
ncbi:MAG: CPBP family intramembrane metalloprotease [Burkholderiales bacterium]|nr:CPBP family intramembrane metalloprotease [Burkholderiales bacterium]